jgi:hypothetical protein
MAAHSLSISLLLLLSPPPTGIKKLWERKGALAPPAVAAPAAAPAADKDDIGRDVDVGILAAFGALNSEAMAITRRWKRIPR